jgi:hypothetical protein
MICYPSTDTYIIFYSQGTCGAFISSLIYEFLIEPDRIIPISERGDAHKRANYYTSNWRLQRNQPGNFFPNFKNITPINPHIPLIIQQHELPQGEEDYKFIFQKFPKNQLIFISYKENNIPIIEKNIDYKLNSLEILSKYKTSINLNYLNLKPNQNFKHTILEFDDIIFNSNKILKILSNVTKSPINNIVISNYEDYLKKQNIHAIH